MGSVREERRLPEVASPEVSNSSLPSRLEDAPHNPVAAARREPLALPEKPSIVVLPFANLSSDPGQGYFTDGMVEEITIALGRLRWLFVIASASAFTYKGRSVDVRQVGRDLAVRYVLGGSVRKDGNRVRITAQLTNSSDGGHIWGDQFEGELDSIFTIQDEVAAKVSTMIAPALRSQEIERSGRKRTGDLTAYDLFLQSSRHSHYSLAQNQESLHLLRRAIELDPSYASAYGLAALCLCWQKVFGWISPADPRVAEGVRLAHLAVEEGQNDSEALWMAAHALIILDGDLELASSAIEKAISLNPNSPNAWFVSGAIHAYLQDATTALQHLARARRLNPFERLAHAWWLGTALAYFFAGSYEESGKAAEKSLIEYAGFPPALRIKIATCGLLGRTGEGGEYVERLLTIVPNDTITRIREYFGNLVRRSPRDFENYFKGLRVCGLPEGEPSKLKDGA